MPAPTVDPQPWHQALVFALIGERHPSLGVQQVPDLVAVETWLREQDLAATVETQARRRASGSAWPYPLPPELAVPAAQFAAALYGLRSRLGLLGPVAAPAPQRDLTADEVRLMRDVPPHHGS